MLSLEVFIPFIVTLAQSWVSGYNADYGNINYSPLPPPPAEATIKPISREGII